MSNVQSIPQRLERHVGLMTTPQVCRLLSMCANTLYKRVRDGHIHAIREGGRLLFDPAEVLRYLGARCTGRSAATWFRRSNVMRKVGRSSAAVSGRFREFLTATSLSLETRSLK
jgi:excisionase family DNA binding protein